MAAEVGRILAAPPPIAAGATADGAVRRRPGSALERAADSPALYGALVGLALASLLASVGDPWPTTARRASRR